MRYSSPGLFVSRENMEDDDDENDEPVLSKDLKLKEVGSRSCDPLRTYSWPWHGYMKSSSDKSCHTKLFL